MQLNHRATLPAEKSPAQLPESLTARNRADGYVVTNDGLVCGLLGEVAIGDRVSTSRRTPGGYIAETVTVVAIDEAERSARVELFALCPECMGQGFVPQGGICRRCGGSTRRMAIAPTINARAAA